MKLITAVIKPFKLDEVREALLSVGVTGLTVTDVKGYGRQKGHTELYRGSEYEVDLLPKTKIDIAVSDDKYDEVLEAVTKAANTSNIGDGKIFVFDARMGERVTKDVIGKCHQCEQPADRHLDCGNDACHILFIQCVECYKIYSGCCSKKCETFSKLPIEEQRVFRKDPDKVVSNARYSSRIKPKLTEIRQS